MENFNLCLSTDYIFGRGVDSQAGEQARRYGAVRALVVGGQASARRSGLWDRVLKSLHDAGITTVSLEGIAPNPTDDRVYEGIELCRRENVDFIMAIGGGSVIDTAKAIAIGVPYEGDFWDFYAGRSHARKALPVGVVLTIPAAGSEGSGNSVITRREGKHKLSVRYPDLLRPRFALMDPSLTLSLPPFPTACGIADMMAHIFERYFSNTPACDVTDSISEALLRTIMRQAAILHAEYTDYDARANIMWAACLAHNGLCGCGKEEDWASHRLEHEVSALYNVAHGAGLAVILPAWLTFVGSRNPGKVVRFATEVMGVEAGGLLPEQIIAEGINRLRDFFSSLGLTTSLRALTGCQPDIDALVASLHANMGERIGSFVSLSMDDCAYIYRLSL